MLLGRIAQPQTIEIDEDNAAQPATVIDPRLAMALGKDRVQPCHLRVRQPEKVVL
jgi:hypothetical protein